MTKVGDLVATYIVLDLPASETHNRNADAMRHDLYMWIRIKRDGKAVAHNLAMVINFKMYSSFGLTFAPINYLNMY